MSYIGVDYGARRVGIAVSDEGGTLAFPAEVVSEEKALLHIVMLAEEREAKGIVIGESKNFQGENNAIQPKIKAFAGVLAQKTGLPVLFEPEFLTSAAAKSAGASEKLLDASAAAFILQSFLDKQKTDNAENPPHANPTHVQEAAPEIISIGDFKKLDIRIGEILFAEKLPGADKLLRLEVSFGNDEKRQIISGIAAHFPDPHMLMGKKVAFAYNLAPRTIRGYESAGMILAATDEQDNFSLLETTGIAAGAKIK